MLASHQTNFDPSKLSGVLNTSDPHAFDNLNAPNQLIVASVTALAVLIAVIILFLVTSLIIEENRSTIGLLQIFGYRKKEVAALLLNSSTPTVIIGFALGIPLMLAFSNALYGLVAETTNMIVPLAMSPRHIAISAVTIFAVYQVTKSLARRRLARIPMSEALKTGNE